MVHEIFGMVVDTKMLKEALTQLSTKVDLNDKKHTEAINALSNSVTSQNTIVLQSLASLKTAFDTFSGQVGPYVDKAENTKSFIHKWSPRLVVVLLIILLLGDKADRLLNLIFKLAGV